MIIFDKYFTLWDSALSDESAFNDLMALFADDVVVQGPQGEVTGKDIATSCTYNYYH